MPDDIIDLDADDEPVVRRPLPSGVDPWALAAYDYRKIRRRSFYEQVEKFGVTIKCILCGKERQVHPVNAGRTLYCSKAHRELGFRLRHKGTELPVAPAANRPWEWRNRERVRDGAGDHRVGRGERATDEAAAI